MRIIYFGFLFVFVIGSIPADGIDQNPWNVSNLSTRLQPQVNFLLSDSGALTLAPSAEASLEYRFPFLPLVFVKTDVGYTAISKETSLLSMIDVGPGVGAFFNIGRIGISAHFSGGLGIGVIADKNRGSTANTSNPYIAAGVNAAYLFPGNFSIGIGTRYKSYVPFPLFHNLSIAAIVSYYFPKKSQAGVIREIPPKVDLINAEFGQVFPVFYKYYDTNPVGTVTIRNDEGTAVRDIKVSLFVSQYMDGSKVSETIKSLEPGGEKTIDLYALFDPRILEITEGTKATAEIKVEYWMGDIFKSKTVNETMQIYDRNAITWEDDRRAAAFVTRKDPAILRLSKLITGAVKGECPQVINKNLANAMAVFEALKIYGMNYEIDPSTPMAEFHEKKTAVDFLQFPKQTLEYRAGDCDDLSILYTALLESIGIETAFITVPGHIFVAFSTEVAEADIEGAFASSLSDFLFYGGKVWVPFEVTDLNGGFLSAWSLGAKAWRDGQRSRTVEFYPMHESWAVYEPVGMPGDPSFRYPDESMIVNAFQEELSLFVKREIRPQEEKLAKAIDEKPDDQRLKNRLGALYGKYGLLDKAEATFQNILQTGSYTPALLNMGNILRLKNEPQRALHFYELAYKEMPDNTTVIASIVSMSYQIGDYEKAAQMYEILAERDPEIADKYVQLAESSNVASRSSEALDFKDTIQWLEE